MPTADKPRRRLPTWVWVAVVAAVAVHGLVLLGVRVRTDDAPAKAGPRPAVSVLPSGGRSLDNAVLRERMELLDPAPLISPTRWNSGAQGLPPELRRQPGEVFGLFEPRLVFPGDRLAPMFEAPSIAPQSPTAALAQLATVQFFGEAAGRRDRPDPKMSERDAGLEVYGFRGGEALLHEDLKNLPDVVKQRDWTPAEFSVVVNRFGLVGLPSLVTSSGAEEIDGFFREFLGRQFRIGERLPPGFYRVVLAR